MMISLNVTYLFQVGSCRCMHLERVGRHDLLDIRSVDRDLHISSHIHSAWVEQTTTKIENE